MMSKIYVHKLISCCLLFIGIVYNSSAQNQVKLNKKWVETTKGFIYSAPMIADVTGDGVYDIVFGDQKGTLTVLNGQSGKKVFEHQFNGAINASPMVGDFKDRNLFDILVCTDKGKIYWIDPRTKNAEKTKVWEWSTKASIQQTPAFGDIRNNKTTQLVVSDEDANIYCITVGDTTPLWVQPLGIPVLTSPVLADFNGDKVLDVVVGCSNGQVYVLNGEDGSKMYKYSTRERVSATPAVGDVNNDGIPDIVVGSEDQKIYAFSKGASDPLWPAYKTNGEIVLAPCLNSITSRHGVQIACVSKDNNCYIVDGASGSILWNIPMDSKISTPPILTDVNQDGVDDLILGTESGKVIIVDGATQKTLDSIDMEGSINAIELGDIDNDGIVDLVITSQQKIDLYTTSIPITANVLIWPTLYGNPTRTGRLDLKYLTSITQKMIVHREEVETVYKQALALEDQKQWVKAIEEFDKVLALNSNHPDAAAQIQKIKFLQRKPIIVRTAVGVLIVVILSLTLWIIRKIRAKRIVDARRLLQENQVDAVLQKYGKMILHKEYNLLPELAFAYARKGDTTSSAIKIYEQVIHMKQFAVTPTEVHYMLAKAYGKENRVDDQARLVYEMASQWKKDDHDILRAYGRASRAKNDTYNLIEQYEKLYQLGQKDSEVIVNLARGYLLSKKSDPNSIQIYQQAVELNPDDKDLVTHVADIYLAQHRNDDSAYFVYGKAAILDPENVFYSLGVANYHLFKKDFKKVVSIVTPILDKDPQNGYVLSLMGRAYLGLLDYTSAVDFLEKALQQSPAEDSLVRDLAYAYAGIQNIGDRALVIFQQAVKNDLSNISLREILAHAYVERCDKDNALDTLMSWYQLDSKQAFKILQEYQTLAKSFPNNTDIRKRIIELQLHLNQFKEVTESVKILEEIGSLPPVAMLEIYTNVIQKDPQNVDTRMNRGRLYASLHQYDEAITDLEWVQQVKSANTEVHELLEQLYIEKLKQNDSNLSYHFKLGLLLYLRGDIERAIEHLQKTVKEGYREQESAKYLGLCFQKRGMLDLAHRQLSKLPLDAEMKDILYGLANDYTEMHQFSKALTILEQIYAEDINYKDLKSTITRLRDQTKVGSLDEMTVLNTKVGVNSAETIMDSSATGTATKKRYEILKEIGRGNMGIVCLAQDKELDETVALKFLPEELHYDAAIVERFKQEVRSTRRLSHPNIVRIHDMADEDGRKFISMEYIDGRNLKDILYEKKKLSPIEVIDIGTQVCAALDYAHKSKVVHRDIKPANIMVTKDGHVKVMDFGIAAMLERAGLTQTGALIGTPLYMSPEQSEGKAVDGRSDIYSFGVMLYELVTGRPPFYSGNISYQHVHVPPPPIEETEVPGKLKEVIFKCMAKAPQDRYQKASECLKDMELAREIK